MMFGRSRRRQPEKLPGGYTPGQFVEGLLYSGEPLPAEIHDQDQVGKGICVFKHPVMLSSEGPKASPPLGYKATRAAFWALNVPDGSLYTKVGWSEIERLIIDQTDANAVRWYLEGLFVGAEFRTIDLEPSPSTAQPLLDLLEEKQVPVEVRSGEE